MHDPCIRLPDASLCTETPDMPVHRDAQCHFNKASAFDKKGFGVPHSQIKAVRRSHAETLEAEQSVWHVCEQRNVVNSPNLAGDEVVQLGSRNVGPDFLVESNHEAESDTDPDDHCKAPKRINKASSLGHVISLYPNGNT